MKLHRWLIVLIVGIAPFVVTGCAASTESATQPRESSIAQETEAPVAQSPETNSAPASTSASTEVLKSGSFASGEHPTTGTAQLVRQESGVVLQLDESFQTSTSGPDLVVALHRSNDVLGSTEPPIYPLVEGEYVVLAPLQKYSGAQTYEIPGDINLNDYQSAVIWCRQFNATFGSAVLR